MTSLPWPGYTGPDPASPDPAGPDPAVARPEPTGHPAVDSALRSLAQAGHAPPAEQVPACEAAHRTLRETLATIDEQ
jgi:hypothetical protein